MIDIHTHLLPGADDGAADWETALKLARAAAAEGIARIVATPHHANGRYTNPADEVRSGVALFNERLSEAGVPVRLYPGQEIRVHGDFLEAWHRGELLTLAGSDYVLIELPSSSVPPRIGDLLHELRLLNLKPIIAHPERNAELASRPGRLAELIAEGAYAQMTTHSLLGGFGRGVQRAAWTLCESGLIHVVSSDAHHPERRGFRLAEAYAAIRSRMGESWASYFEDNAGSILDNRALGAAPPIEREERLLRRLFGFFGGR